MQGRNQLAPEGFAAKLKNFAANLLWALVWLAKWCVRLVRRWGYQKHQEE